jgi:hypothetical protein
MTTDDKPAPDGLDLCPSCSARADEAVAQGFVGIMICVACSERQDKVLLAEWMAQESRPPSSALDPEVRALLWLIAAEVLPGVYCVDEVAPGGIVRSL